MTSTVQQIAEDFVEEYLQRDIDYSDVAEFMAENGVIGYVGTSVVHDRVQDELETILMRWLERNR